VDATIANATAADAAMKELSKTASKVADVFVRRSPEGCGQFQNRIYKISK
jgi:hypothetical protein